MNRRKRYANSARAFLLVIIFIISVSGSAHASTVVTGSIPDGTVWNTEGSPYLISEAVEVPAGATLSIEPGTVIKLGNGSASIEVSGKVNASGTETEPVTFTSWNDDSVGGDTNGTDTAPAFFDWNGVNFLSGSWGLFRYVNVSYGVVSSFESTLTFENNHFQHAMLSLSGRADVNVISSVFDDAPGSAIAVDPDAYVYIANSTIARAKMNALAINGGYARLSYTTISDTVRSEFGNAVQIKDGGMMLAEHATFDGGTNGVKLMGGSSLNMTNAVIKNFTGTGVFDTINAVLMRATPSQVTGISLAAAAIKTASADYDPADITITDSEIFDNGVGIQTRSNSGSTVNNNSIHDNRYGADGGHFENNWWGDPSGPYDPTANPHGLGNEVTDSVFYTPWLTVDPINGPVMTCCSSVAFLPGLEGSRLYSGTDNGAKLWEPFGNADVKKMYLNADGTSIDQTIYTKDIMDRFKAFGIFGSSIYKGFMDEMDSLVNDDTIAAWKAFPYDWRQSVTDIVAGGIQTEVATENMEQEIESLAAGSKSGKVTIVAHSNGGLLAKALMIKLESDGKADLVDKIIMVAVPQLGTPDTLKAMLHGISIGGGFVLDKKTARGLAENMPGAYGLLPSQKYMESVSDPIVTFDPSVGDISNLIQEYGDSISTIESLYDFLHGADGRPKPTAGNTSSPNVLSESLLMKAKELHDALDNWTPPDPVKVVQLAGWGMSTLKGIDYTATYPCSKLLQKGICAPYLDEQPLLTKEGDDTVVYPSATALATDTYYFNLKEFNENSHKNVVHATLFESDPVLDFLKKEITQSDEQTPFIDTVKPTTDSLGESLTVSMHSPASIDLYDAAGNHTGLLPTQSNSEVTQYEENIPNSYFIPFGEGTYAGFDLADGHTIKIQGTGTGTFTFVMDHQTGDTIAETETFAGIPVTPSTKASISVSESGSSDLQLDVDGNGSTDFTIQPTGNNPDDVLDPTLFLQIMKQTVQSPGNHSKKERQLCDNIDRAIAFVRNHKKKKTFIPSLKQFSRDVERQGWGRVKRLSTEQHDSFLEMVNRLVDTIK